MGVSIYHNALSQIARTEPRRGQRLPQAARRADPAAAVGWATRTEALLFPSLPDVPSSISACTGLVRGASRFASAERDAGSVVGGMATTDGFATRGSAICTASGPAALKPTLRQVHIAGERLFVDFAGHTMEVIDAATVEIQRAEIFVAVLGVIRASPMPKRPEAGTADWIGAHVNALASLGGAPRQIVSDNLKAGTPRPASTNRR